MDTQDRQEHWQGAYTAKTEREVSWTQDLPEPSLSLVIEAASSPDAPIVDIGGGSSRLVDHLVHRGFTNVAVVDLSSAALDHARTRLGPSGQFVDWITADITKWVPTQRYEVWHDRATFHFMVSEVDRSAYLACLRQGLARGGHAIIATFALDGPEKCSGLPVMRYDSARLAEAFGPEFLVIKSFCHTHYTPWGSPQPFQFNVLKRT